MTRLNRAPALVLALLLVGSVLGGVVTLTTPAAAVQDTVTIHDSPQGTVTSFAKNGTQVFVKVDVSGSGTNGSTTSVNVTNGTGTNVSITLRDDGNVSDDTSSDGVYWGSFNVSSTTTDDATDTLFVQEGDAATVTADLDGDSTSGTASITADYTPPKISSATTKDTNGDGTVDIVTITFNESIDDANSTLDGTALALSTGSVTSVTSGTTDDDTVNISTSITGTSATPNVTLNASKVFDAAGNSLDSDQAFTGTTDGAAPIVLRIALTDLDANGKIDAANVSFSEQMDDSTFTPADWSINSTAAEGFDTLVSANDATVQLNITTDVNEANGTNITGVNVAYTPGSVASASGESLSAVGDSDIVEIDEAKPHITSFSATNPSGSQIDLSVVSEERLTTIQVSLVTESTLQMTAAFTESGSGPYTYTESITGNADGDYTVTLLNASDVAGNNGSIGQTQSVSIDTSSSSSSSNSYYDYDDDDEETTTPSPTPTSTMTSTPPPTQSTPGEGAPEAETSTVPSSPETATSTATAGGEMTTSSGQPGFGVGISLLAIALLAGLFHQNTRE